MRTCLRVHACAIVCECVRVCDARRGCVFVCACLHPAFVLLSFQNWEHLNRIVTTPTPFVYRHLLSTLIFIYVFTFPFAFVASLKYFSIPCTMGECLCTCAIHVTFSHGLLLFVCVQ
ncbi:bestrophin family ion channel [Silvimonas sp.]|uniref:bestrophin family ion channel n=1 Tax=Silvimonas sp. TaxID=2650811 RepID=UPI00386D00B9